MSLQKCLFITLPILWLNFKNTSSCHRWGLFYQFIKETIQSQYDCKKNIFYALPQNMLFRCRVRAMLVNVLFPLITSGTGLLEHLLSQWVPCCVSVNIGPFMFSNSYHTRPLVFQAGGNTQWDIWLQREEKINHTLKAFLTFVRYR